jgi:hypothetical protein
MAEEKKEPPFESESSSGVLRAQVAAARQLRWPPTARLEELPMGPGPESPSRTKSLRRVHPRRTIAICLVVRPLRRFCCLGQWAHALLFWESPTTFIGRVVRIAAGSKLCGFRWFRVRTRDRTSPARGSE